jgi:hypothetical protein
MERHTELCRPRQLLPGTAPCSPTTDLGCRMPGRPRRPLIQSPARALMRELAETRKLLTGTLAVMRAMIRSWTGMAKARAPYGRGLGRGPGQPVTGCAPGTSTAVPVRP